MKRFVPFRKMHGAGNDFIMLTGRDLDGRVLDREAITALCNRRTGIGGDGLIIVTEPVDTAAAFRMIYFNADGGEAEMCGNGARCAVDFAVATGLARNECSFETGSGMLTGRVFAPGDVEVSLPVWRELETGIRLEDAPWPEQHFCNTGVPHLVIAVPDVEEVDVRRWGAFFRNHQRFAPAGTNVNWVGPGRREGEFLIRTFERGVEDETLACGTGASAAAVVMCHLGKAASPVSLRTAGGDLLVVTVDPQGEELRLRGPAVTSFTGEVRIDD